MLDLARVAGWHFYPMSDHAFGRVSCAPSGSDRCTYLIFSTGRDGETAAKSLGRLIASCPHARALPPMDRALLEAGRATDRAGLLLDAARLCIESGAEHDRAAELLLLASESLDASELYLEEATVAEERGADAGAAAELLLQELDPAITVSVREAIARPSQLIDAAEASVGQAAEVLKVVPGGSERRRLRDTVRALRDQAQQLRRQLPPDL